MEKASDVYIYWFNLIELPTYFSQLPSSNIFSVVIIAVDDNRKFRNVFFKTRKKSQNEGETCYYRIIVCTSGKIKFDSIE